jgi:hypothetical protein
MSGIRRREDIKLRDTYFVFLTKIIRVMKLSTIGSCHTQQKEGNGYKFKQKEHLENLYVDGSRVLKRIIVNK